MPFSYKYKREFKSGKLLTAVADKWAQKIHLKHV